MHSQMTFCKPLECFQAPDFFVLLLTSNFNLSSEYSLLQPSRWAIEEEAYHLLKGSPSVASSLPRSSTSSIKFAFQSPVLRTDALSVAALAVAAMDLNWTRKSFKSFKRKTNRQEQHSKKKNQAVPPHIFQLEYLRARRP